MLSTYIFTTYNLLMQAITNEKFTSLVGQGSGVVLVDFWAPRCGPCLIIKPELEKLGVEMSAKATFYACNVDEEGDLSMQFGIRSIPTVMIFVNGELKEKIVGVNPIHVYKEKIEQYGSQITDNR